MGLEAHSSLARLQEAWPTVKGLADSPNNAAEWVGRKPDGKALRMAALQRAISHADADARAATLFATLKADPKGASSQARSAALADLARLRSCAGSLASACLTTRPGPVELTAVEFCISAHLRLGEDLFAGQDGDDACVCGRSMAAGGTHSLICGALWHTVVACHNILKEAWLRIAACGGIAATREPNVKQQRPQPSRSGPSPPHPPPACALRWRAHAGSREPCSPRHPPPHPRLGRAFYPPRQTGSSPTCPLRLSSATHPWGRGRCRTLRSCRSRRGLSSSRSRCGQCRCCPAQQWPPQRPP